MKKALTLVVGLVVFLGFMAGNSYAFFIDFESGYGNDGGYINDIPGVSFVATGTGNDWIYGDSSTGGYNTRSIELGYGTGSYQHYGNVFAWLGTSTGVGKIDFTNNDGSWFRTGYTSYSNFYLEGYNSSGQLIASVIGGANLYGADMGWLQINAPTGQYFDYVLVHDTGNYFLLDQMSGDTTGVGRGQPIPEPATLVLLGSGLFGLAGFRRKRT